MLRRPRLLIALFFVAAAGAFTFLCRHALLLRLASAVSTHRSAEREARNGFRVEFTILPREWIAPIRTDMDDAWRPLGRHGINYFTFGAPANLFASHASHTDPGSPRYQAWFGTYVVEADAAADLPQDEAGMTKLADGLLSHDGLRWLRTVGDPQPSAVMGGRQRSGELVIDGVGRPLFEGDLTTHSDLPADPIPRIAGFIGRPDPSSWSAELAPYHGIVMEGFVAVWTDPPRRSMFAVYGNGVRYTTRSGRTVRTYPSLKDELLRMAGGIRIR